MSPIEREIMIRAWNDVFDQGLVYGLKQKILRLGIGNPDSLNAHADLHTMPGRPVGTRIGIALGIRDQFRDSVNS